MNHRSSIETAKTVSKPRSMMLLWDKPDGNSAYWSGGTRYRGGVNLLLAFAVNHRNLS